MAKRITEVKHFLASDDGRPASTRIYGADGPAHTMLMGGFISEKWAKVIAETLGVPLEVLPGTPIEPEHKDEDSLF